MSKASYWQRGETLDYKNTGATTIEANTVIELTGRVGIAGTAVWSEGKQEKAKASPATATAGLAGESKNGETPENVVGRVPKTPTRSKGAKKNG